MISNAEYLIQKYAEAREKQNEYGSVWSTINSPAKSYWKGVMDTYHSILNSAFDDWAANGTTGYFVFYERMTYDQALNAINQAIA
jgi:hypothetical protein